MIVSLLAPVVAFAIVLGFVESAVALVTTIRIRDFRRFENRSREKLKREFSFPIVRSESVEETREFLPRLVTTEHNAAKTAQTIYHNAVVRSVGCLAIGFLALVIDTSIRDLVWPVSTFGDLVENVLAWVDVLAFVLVLLLFFRARRAGTHWITARVGAELLRQYQFLHILFPSTNAAAKAEEFKKQFDLEAKAIKKGANIKLISRIESVWLDRKASILKGALSDSDISSGGLIIYLKSRALRQLGWFLDSKDRLESIAERRGFGLILLYGVAAVVATGKLLMFLYSGRSPTFLVSLLLIVSGVSGAMTAYYTNQNARSLIHRYNAQIRRITEWLNEFDKRWRFADLSSLTVDSGARNDIRALVLQFEGLMIEELIDWTHITSYDAMELAP